MHAHDLKTGGNGSLVKLRGVHVLAQIFEMWQFWCTLYELNVQYEIQNRMTLQKTKWRTNTPPINAPHIPANSSIVRLQGSVCTPTN